jgi:hypothetical protein
LKIAQWRLKLIVRSATLRVNAARHEYQCGGDDYGVP